MKTKNEKPEERKTKEVTEQGELTIVPEGALVEPKTIKFRTRREIRDEK